MPRFIPVLGGFSVAHSILRDATAYWPLATEGAVDLLDYVGDNDLTNNNGVTRADGPSANLPDAAAFVAASSQHFSVASNPSLSLNATDWEISGWFWLTDITGNYQIISKDVEGNREFAISVNTTPRLRVELLDGTNVLGAAQVPVTLLAETWYHFSVRYSASTRAGVLLLNNANSTPLTSTGDMIATDAALQIGARAFSTSRQFFNGRISQIVYRKVIGTDAERAWLYNGGAGRSLV